MDEVGYSVPLDSVSGWWPGVRATDRILREVREDQAMDRDPDKGNPYCHMVAYDIHMVGVVVVCTVCVLSYSYSWFVVPCVGRSCLAVRVATAVDEVRPSDTVRLRQGRTRASTAAEGEDHRHETEIGGGNWCDKAEAGGEHCVLASQPRVACRARERDDV